MKTINYILAIALIVLWSIGFFNHIAGSKIHFLFVGALLLILINIIWFENTTPQENTNNKN